MAKMSSGVLVTDSWSVLVSQLPTVVIKDSSGVPYHDNHITRPNYLCRDLDTRENAIR